MPKYRITNPDGKKYDVTVPEGTTPEQAYSILQQQQKPSEPKSMLNPVGQGIASVLSNAALAPAAGLAGLAGAALPGPQGQGADWVNKVQGLAYQPVTDMGKQATAAFNYPFQKIGEGFDWLGGQTTDATGSPGLGVLANVGPQALLMASGVKPALKPTPGPLRGTAEWMMNSALKPTIADHMSGDAALAAKTMLDQGYNATKGGVLDISNKVTDLNQQVKNLIANSPATIDKGAVYGRLGDVESRFTNQVNPAADLNAIQGVGDQFLSHPLLSGQSQIPVQLAQDLKTGTQRQLKDSYGELSGAATEAQKALARGLREEIATAVPGVADKLSQERDLIRTLDVAERRALMDMNKNPAGLSLLANNPIAAAGFMADKSALFKSILARMINSTSKALPLTPAMLSSGVAITPGALSD